MKELDFHFYEFQEVVTPLGYVAETMFEENYNNVDYTSLKKQNQFIKKKKAKTGYRNHFIEFYARNPAFVISKGENASKVSRKSELKAN